jgi:hypothetical protein
MKNKGLGQEPMNKLFIKEWLNHFNIHYEADIPVPSSRNLDYFVAPSNFGIIVNEWNKPISVKIINQAINLKNELDLRELIVVCESIGDYAAARAKKMDKGVKVILNRNLSDLAVEIANMKVFSVGTSIKEI